MIPSTFEELRTELNRNSGVLFLTPLAEDLYRSHEALSQSEIKVVADGSPAHLRYQRRHRRPPTDSMKLGTAAHTAILEPLKFEERYMKAFTVDKRSKAGRTEWAALKAHAEALGKEILVGDDYETPLLMRDAVRSNPEISRLLVDGVSERSCFGYLHGVHAKARPDYYRPKEHEIIDVKSTRCASLRQFERDVRSYRYHWQACWYTDIVKEITGEAPAFKIVAIESHPPYCSAVFSIKFDLMAIARREMMETLDTIKRCMDTGIWPGYPTTVNELGAFKWEWDAYKKSLQESA